MEIQISDLQFQNTNIKSETQDLRETIKFTDENYKGMLRQKSIYEKQNLDQVDETNKQLKETIQNQLIQIENQQISIAEFKNNIEELQNEKKALVGRVQQLQREADEFEHEFKRWEKQFHADQKLKIAKIDKLQCEIENLQEALEQKDQEVQALQIQKTNSELLIEFGDNISPLTPQIESPDVILTDVPQNEQISQEDLLNRTGYADEFLELTETDRNGNFQDFITEEIDDQRQQFLPDASNTYTRFASFIDEKKLSTETDLVNELFVQETPAENKNTENLDETFYTQGETTIELRRQPEEEYFRLSVLSLKMQYNERDIDFVFQISSSKLYRLCKKENVPFHKWYNWIEYQLLLIDQAENPNSSQQKLPTTLRNTLIEQDKQLSAKIKKGKAQQRQHQIQPLQVQTGQQNAQPQQQLSFFQRFSRKYFH